MGRENNFHILRMVAATMVLVSHSFAIATGDPSKEPLRLWLGVTPGTIAVDVFFIISGLLVTQSMERHANAISFGRARFLRIWPGLFVALVFTVFLLGSCLTRLELLDYLTDTRTWQYLLRNLIVVYKSSFSLPGVFEKNPYPDSFNGSLWTLKYEVRAYIFMLLLWLVANNFLRMRRVGGGGRKLFSTLVLCIACLTMLGHVVALSSVSVEASTWRLYAMFAIGGALYVLRSYVPLAIHWGVICAIALLSSSIYQPLFGYIYSITLPYLVIWIAYAPSGVLINYNRAGDYSYGTYIYAFPIQQTVAWWQPGIGIAELLGISFVVTLFFAAASWHFVEKPAMNIRAQIYKRPHSA